MEAILSFIKDLSNPDKLIHLLNTLFMGGWAYVFLFAIIFAETGLLIGFFLPGDSLLFTIGVIAGSGHLNVILIMVTLIVAAIVGDSVGYFLGRYMGQHVFNRPNSWLFNKKHLDRTREFYEKNGMKTIIYARFLPIIRTFAPFVAGAAEMDYKSFFLFNVIGGIGWVLLMTSLGYWLGNITWVHDNFEKFIIGIILLSFIPPLIEVIKGKGRRQVDP